LSINDYADDLESAARLALAKANAIEVCQFHSDATIRLFDDDAERRAYAIGTNMMKRDGTPFMREDLMAEIQRQLEEADEQCNQCANAPD
jgi:hypothetical protein